MAVPFVANGVPRGLVALIVDKPNFRVEFPADFSQMVSKLGAFYLDTLDFGAFSNGNSLSITNPEDLTTRQMAILGHIETGLVNFEIAKILMLSESTIRQETVKIYRALGVGNRQEAVKKAKALGLLPKRASVPDQASISQ
jgi:DNA-binding NarL/FixJ family response regulator